MKYRLGGLNMQPALGFTRVPDDLSPFSPIARAIFGEGSRILNPGWIDQKQLYRKLDDFSKNHLTPDELINRSCPFLRAGTVCSMEADPSMNQPTAQTTTPVTISHISVLDGFGRLNRNQYVYCWVMMGIIWYYLILSPCFHVLLPYCSNPNDCVL